MNKMLGTQPFTNSNLALLVILLISLNIVMILSVNGDWFNRRGKTENRSLISQTYYSVVNPWGDPDYISQSNIKGIDTSKCNWYTYENVLGINKKAQVSTALEDFNAGYSHLSPPQPCFDSDQIVFRTAKRGCSGTGVAECIGASGHRYGRGDTENFNSVCSGQNIPACESTIGSLSFNFFQKSDNSPIDQATRFMTFERIFVSKKTFNTIDNDVNKQFYTREGELFSQTDALEITDSQYIPLIRQTGKQEGNFKQNLKIVRYSYEGDYTEDNNGPYAEILFRPQNLYLNLDFNNTENQIGEISVNDSDNMQDLQNVYQDDLRIRKMFDSDKKPTGDTCTAVIINKVATVTMFLRGNNSRNTNDILTIEDDLGTTGGLRITVATLVDHTNFLTLSQKKKKWLLIPPLPLNGSQVFPRTDRSSLIPMLNQIFMDVKAPCIEGSSIYPCEDCSSSGIGCFDATNNQDFLYGPTGLYNGSSFIVGPKKKYLFRDIWGGNTMGEPNTDMNPKDDGWGTIWTKMVETDLRCKGDTFCNCNQSPSESNRNLTFIKNDGSGEYFGDLEHGLTYPDNFFEDYIESTNTGLVSQSSPFYSIKAYRAAVCNTSPSCGGGDGNYYSKCGLSYSIKSEGAGPLPGQTVQDGSVKWNVVSGVSQVFVYGSDYFTNTSLIGGPVTDFTILTKQPLVPDPETNRRYQQPKKGTVTEVDFSSYDISPEGQELQGNTYSSQTLRGSNSGATNCTVDIVVQKGKIVSINIDNPGSGYQDQETCSVELTDSITIENILINAEDIVYRLVAYPIYNFPIDYQDGDPSPAIVNYGFELDSSKITIGGGGTTLSLGKNKPQNCIISGGNGYQGGGLIYIDQIDQNGRSTINPGLKFDSNSVKGKGAAIQIGKVEKTADIKVTNLMAPGIILGDYADSGDLYTWYNFYEKDPADTSIPSWEDSPPQIGYISEDEESNINAFITSGGSSQFMDYLKDDFPGGVNSTLKLYTLQLKSLNYKPITSSSSADPGLIPTETTININSNEQLILGKFIPHSRFGSLRPDPNKQSPHKTIDQKYWYNYDYYTSNNCRFIPNSISSIYNRNIDIKKVPSF